MVSLVPGLSCVRMQQSGVGIETLQNLAMKKGASRPPPLAQNLIRSLLSPFQLIR